MTNEEKILKILNDSDGIITTKEIKEKTVGSVINITHYLYWNGGNYEKIWI